MSNPFFDHPVINSPYKYPSRHWELDDTGQPTQKVIQSRRGAYYCNNKDALKYRVMFKKAFPKAESRWAGPENEDGKRIRISANDIAKLQSIERVYRLVSQRAPSYSEQTVYDYFFNDQRFQSPKGGSWVTTKEKMDRLNQSNRLPARATYSLSSANPTSISSTPKMVRCRSRSTALMSSTPTLAKSAPTTPTASPAGSSTPITTKNPSSSATPTFLVPTIPTNR